MSCNIAITLLLMNGLWTTIWLKDPLSLTRHFGKLAKGVVVFFLLAKSILGYIIMRSKTVYTVRACTRENVNHSSRRKFSNLNLVSSDVGYWVMGTSRRS